MELEQLNAQTDTHCLNSQEPYEIHQLPNKIRSSYTRRICIVSLLVNVILIIILILTVVIAINNRTERPTLGGVDHHGNTAIHRTEYVDDDTNAFIDLTNSEIRNVLNFLYMQTFLQLNNHSDINDISRNYIYAIELHVPSKGDAIQFLDNDGPLPDREAKVIVFCPTQKPPVVREYIVFPLPNPSKIRPNDRVSNWEVPFRLRQIGFQELWQIYQRLYQYANLDKILFESYGASLFNCIRNGVKNCLSLHRLFVSSDLSKERKLWLMLFYDMEYYTLHPIDMQILMNVDSLNTSRWRIDGVWYGQTFYSNFEQFVQLYNSDKIHKVRVSWLPKPFREDTTTTRPVSQSPVRQYEPNGHRYTVNGQRLRYSNWSFRWRMSIARGPSLFDIQFKDKRIVYELALQEIAVLYGGKSPAFASGMHAESFGGLSANLPALVPGVDCPDHATFLDVKVLTEDDITNGNYSNSICVFELNQGRPLRRHYSNSPGHGGIFYTGLASTVLVFRTIFAVYNYDYIIDYVFYESGHIEVKVFISGFIIMSSGIKPEGHPSQFGDKRTSPIQAHCLNFKVDFDINGLQNRYIIQRLRSRNITDYFNNSRQIESVHKEDIVMNSENEAIFQKGFKRSDHHVFVSSKAGIADGTYKGGYAVSSRSWAYKSVLTSGEQFDLHFPWVRYPIAVSVRKDHEESSSSMYATVDGERKTVNFLDFFEDDETIIDQDLVAWVTIGDTHIPSTENIPNMVTPERELSFLLSPHNYFPSDPSSTSPHSVYIAAKDPLDVRKGVDVRVSEIPHNSNCPREEFNLKSLEKNWTSIFGVLP